MPVIFVAVVFWLCTRTARVPEEPGNYIDYNDNPNNDIILTDDISPHCPINYAETAGTAHFSLAEFHSKDGTLVPKSIRGNVQMLMERLEIIRAFFPGTILVITSGYRSIPHNENVGGVAGSQHLCGTAADFYIPGISNSEVQDAIEYLIASDRLPDGGLGKYNNFTHYDTGNPRRWNG